MKTADSEISFSPRSLNTDIIHINETSASQNQRRINPACSFLDTPSVAPPHFQSAAYAILPRVYQAPRMDRKTAY